MATPRDASDPDELARREFTKTRKGVDPVEVKAHLVLMADEIKRLQRHEAELQASVSSMSAQLDRREPIDESTMAQVLGEETVRIVEAARSAAADIRAKAEDSSSRLVKEAQERATRLQQEAIELRANAAREADELLGSARSRADEMLADARRESEELRRDAELDATAMRDKASSVLAERTAEAEEEAERIRAAAAEHRADAEEYAERTRRESDDAAAEVRREAEESARVVREDADAAALKVRSDAAAAAERRAEEAAVAASREVERAREQGRTMVREARDARERMLRDLAERRKGARQQLEALRAGRERMLEVFASAREALDSATGGFEESLASARDAADEAARGVDDDLDEAFAELDAEIPGGLIGDLDEAIAPDGGATDSVPTAPDEPDVEPYVALGVEPAIEVVPFEPEPHESESHESESHESELHGSESHGAEVPAADKAAALTEPAPEVGEPAAEPRGDGGHLRLVEGSGIHDDDEDDDLDDLEDLDDEDDDSEDDDSDDDEDAGADHQGPTGNVEEIFARIRAGRGDDDPADPTGSAPSIEGAEDEAADQQTDIEATDDGPPGEVIALNGGSSDSEVADDSEHDADQDVLDRRDALVEPIEAQLVRQLKRQVSQHENQLLDQLRKRKRSTAAVDVLGSVEDFARVIAAPLKALGAQAFAAGVTVVDPNLEVPEFPAEAYDDYAREWVSTALRSRLERALAVDADEVGGGGPGRADRTHPCHLSGLAQRPVGRGRR